MIESNMADMGPNNRSIENYICGNLYLKSGVLDSATYFYKKSLQYKDESSRVGTFYGLSQIEKQRGHYKEAMMYADSAQHYWEKSCAQTNAEAMARMTAVYNYQQTMNRIAPLEEAIASVRLVKKEIEAAGGLLA